MRDLRLIKEPRQHFATFWKQKNPDGVVRARELRAELGEVVDRVQSGDFLARCATVELLPPTTTTATQNPGEDGAESPTPKVPGVYWVVPGDLLELALLALEMVEQEDENERLEKLKESFVRSPDADAV